MFNAIIYKTDGSLYAYNNCFQIIHDNDISILRDFGFGDIQTIQFNIADVLKIEILEQNDD